jgi:hypothetical protein
MKSRSVICAVGVLSVLVLLPGAGAAAQSRSEVHLSGLINDYSPSTVKGGPWEMHGQWTLSINESSGTADFSADMTMSGYGKTASGAVDPTQAGVGAHTHHIKLTGAAITWDTTGCPPFNPGYVMGYGFQIKKTVKLMTGNGSNAPFETTPPSSVLQVCVSGGEGNDSILLSNITLQFETGSPAITHFGPQAIHGVVRKSQLSGN